MAYMSTWNEFTEAIKDARTQLGNPEIVWYRGQRDKDWGLNPSLCRYTNGLAKERALFDRFARISRNLMNDSRSDWEVLFDMQHYYVPTRLLDWSEALGVSTYFAIMGWNRYRDENIEPCLWVLDPLKLNNFSTKRSEIKRTDSNFDYKNVYWEKQPTPTMHPIAIEPPYRNERIRAQRGAFTIHGEDQRPLNEICPDCVKQVVLPPMAIPQAEEFLEFANINQFSVFPDIEGLAPFVKEIVGLS